MSWAQRCRSNTFCPIKLLVKFLYSHRRAGMMLRKELKKSQKRKHGFDCDRCQLYLTACKCRLIFLAAMLILRSFYFLKTDRISVGDGHGDKRKNPCDPCHVFKPTQTSILNLTIETSRRDVSTITGATTGWFLGTQHEQNLY